MAVGPSECQQENEPQMPTYEYACKSCGEHLEVVQSFKDEALVKCPACGGPLRKVFGSIGIAFKGSGFYRTDSRSGSRAGSAAESRGDSKASESASKAGESASKADSKAGESKASGDSKSKSKGDSKSKAAAAS